MRYSTAEISTRLSDGPDRQSAARPNRATGYPALESGDHLVRLRVWLAEMAIAINEPVPAQPFDCVGGFKAFTLAAWAEANMFIPERSSWSPGNGDRYARSS
jgi:hypothetical protein